jgi:GAF domain-containing protein
VGAYASDATELATLRTRVEELERERDHLVAVVDILQELSSSRHFVDTLQTIARKLGEAFGLDRCSIFLAAKSAEVRLVASYEDPTLRNLVVDLDRYPELKRAFESGETVFIADAANDPMLSGIKALLDMRNVRSIVVVPIRWRGSVIGAIFLRTERGGALFSEADIRFCQMIASLTAKALHNTHRVEARLRSTQVMPAVAAVPDPSAAGSRGDPDAERRRAALVAFLRRLLDRYAGAEAERGGSAPLPAGADAELDRLVGVAMQVLTADEKR